ncbi:MAG: glycosyltransferase [Patescibacteria group bacterium]|nr:glycosyltransferase [Patescibacteria group bacterium]
MNPKSGRPPKIAVVHDHLGFQGGGERTMFILAIAIGADFITAYANKDTFPEYQKQLGEKLKVLTHKTVSTRVIRFFWLRWLYWKNKRIFSGYDILIASGQTATEAVAHYSRPKATRMVYTHTPPRRIFDQYEVSKHMYPWFLRPAYAIFTRYWKLRYLRAIRKFDINIANSENVRKRFKNYVGGDVSAVIWPPIATQKFKWLGQEDYFLSWARIDEAKRVDLVARAFVKMPDAKLKIASCGPWQDKVLSIIKGCPNISFVGKVTDQELIDLVGNCKAAVYIPSDEDAGMTQLEANAAGKPVLGVAEGGLLETIVDGETGVLIPANPNEADVIKGAEIMTPEWCALKKDICIEHAKKYDEKIFIKKMRNIIESNDPQIPVLGIDASRWEDPRFPGENRRTGVNIYAKHIIEELIKLAPEYNLRIRLYTPRTIPELPLEIQKVIPGNRFWTQCKLTKELRYSPPDYFFTPSYYIPKTAPKNSLAAVHDIIFRTSPSNYSRLERLQQEFAVRQNIKHSRDIITISEFSKNEIAREYKVDPERIKVISLGHDIQENLDRQKPREKLVVYVGRIEKKKSVNVLVQAFAKFHENNPDWQLILAGGLGYGVIETRDLIEKLNAGSFITMPGYLDEEQKWDLLTKASIFCHPSEREGSCLPLFEAWDACVPAIIADVPIMREVGKDGAMYFSAGNFHDLAAKLKILSSDDDLREKLVRSGFDELKKRNWKEIGRETMEAILEK